MVPPPPRPGSPVLTHAPSSLLLSLSLLLPFPPPPTPCTPHLTHRCAARVRLSPRSYHAFYYLLHGAPALAEACKLSATSSYRYLTPTGSAAAPADAAACARDFSGVDDGLRALLAASGAVPAAEVAERALFYWRTIAGVLLLGQVQFEPRDEGAGCEIDAPSHAALEAAAALWGCDAAATAALEQALLTRTVQLAGQSSERYPRDAKQARGQADALAKELYDRLFTMVVHEVGGALGEADGGGGGDGGGDSPPGMVRFESSASTDWGPLPHIGLLDIFGFEIFDGDVGAPRIERSRPG